MANGWSTLGNLFKDFLPGALGYYGLSQLGKTDAPSAGEMAGSTIGATTEMLPEYLQMLRREAPAQAEAEQALREQFAPDAARLQFQLADEYMPKYGQIGRDEAYYDRMLDAAGGVDVLRGPGGAMIDEAFARAQQVDQPFYQQRAAAGGMLGDLLSSFVDPRTQQGGDMYDPNRPGGRFTGALSGSEEEMIERSLGRQGAKTGALSGPQSMQNVVSNAMLFGQGVQGRRDALGRALGQATSFLPASRSGFDPFQVAMGRPSQQFGAQQFSQPQINSQGVMNQGSNVFNAASGMAQSAAGFQAAQPSALDRIGQVSKMFPGGLTW
jgi:hypothetical protein